MRVIKLDRRQSCFIPEEYFSFARLTAYVFIKKIYLPRYTYIDIVHKIYMYKTYTREYIN